MLPVRDEQGGHRQPYGADHGDEQQRPRREDGAEAAQDSADLCKLLQVVFPPSRGCGWGRCGWGGKRGGHRYRLIGHALRRKTIKLAQLYVLFTIIV